MAGSEKSKGGGSQKARPMSIAVVGLAGRFPGDATSPQSLWEMCCNGRSACAPIPDSRFNKEAYFHPDPSKSGCFNTKSGHFLKEDVGLFDAAFFGISPNEAKAMDPQQRLLLETTYEALENAGISTAKIANSETGVYVGASEVGYTSLIQRDIDITPLYGATGTSANTLSNRISYVFDLKGPSMTMDTACSSSLTALHIACQNLQSHEIDQAIVCGSHIILNPDTMVSMSMIKLFGADGRSHAFDSRGTGFGRGEGVVAFVLKPLDVAINNRDNIRAVIRGSGVNQDGKTNGITLPNKESQAKLIQSTYESASLNPLDTKYVEAHGTGTAAGDPIEAEAIAKVFSKGRATSDPLLVGSVKTNIGHLEAASGLAGLVKVIFALENGIIPPNFNFEAPNKNILFEQWKIKVPTSLTPWPESHIRRASISNYGFGGTNVHVIIDQYNEASWKFDHPSRLANGVRNDEVNGVIDGLSAQDTGSKLSEPSNGFPELLNGDTLHQGRSPSSRTLNGKADNAESSMRQLFIFSANDKAALKTQMNGMATYLARAHTMSDEKLLKRLAYTLCSRRSDLESRAAVSACSTFELRDKLAECRNHRKRLSTKPKVGFIFTGQGAQWPTMGQELNVFPVYRDSISESDGLLRKLGADWSLAGGSWLDDIEVITLILVDELACSSKSSSVHRPSLSQPATTAVQIALTLLLSSWGISPATVLGHSSGEIAAAFAAGNLSATDCMRIAFHRGRLSETLKERRPDRRGRMIAIGTSEDQVQSMLDKIEDGKAVVACLNSPALVTVSGDESAILKLRSQAEQKSLMARILKVDVAYHSSHMKEIETEYFDAIHTAPKSNDSTSSIEFHSSVTGSKLNGETLEADYWVKNLTSPVKFLSAVNSIFREEDPPSVFIEIGPHSALKAPFNEILKQNTKRSSEVSYIPTLIRNENGASTMFELACSMFELGHTLYFDEINQAAAREDLKPIPDLPSYPWNHSKRHWHESRLSKNHLFRRFSRNDLIGNLVDDYNENEPRWRNILRISDLPWLSDHRVQSSVVFPLAGYLAMSIEAIIQQAALRDLQLTSDMQYRLKDVEVNKPLVIPETDAVEISLVMRPQEKSSGTSSNMWYKFTIYSWMTENGWSQHCNGLISLYRPPVANATTSNSTISHIRRAHWQPLMEENERICEKEIDAIDIYSRFQRGGLEFGPLFRNITGARVKQNHSIANVRVPETKKSMPFEHSTSLLIHPCILDAWIQVIVLATNDRDLSGSDSHVPTFIKDIRLRHGLLPLPSGHETTVFAHSSQKYSEKDSDVHARFIAFDRSDSSRVIIEVEDLVATRLQGSTEDIRIDSDRDICHQTSYEPCVDLLSPPQFTSLYHNSSREPECCMEIRQLEKTAFYCFDLYLPTLTADDLDITEPYLCEYYKVTKALLSRNEIAFKTPEWQTTSRAEKEAFLTEISASNDCARLICSVGKNIEAIIAEEVSPLPIMTRDNMLEKYYKSNPLSIYGEQSIKLIMKNLVFQLPGMTILEVGAGTGGTTRPVLGTICENFSRYDFTDISTGFFESAKQKFQDWGELVQYRKLNIEEDPVGQGFEEGSYDLIIASNVLHATVSIERTLTNVRKLLRPGGKLLLGEITSHLLSIHLVFGTLPGWWLADEPDRKDAPFLSVEKWDSMLRKTGFSGCDGNAQVRPEGVCCESYILSTALDTSGSPTPPPSLVAHDGIDESLTQAISNELPNTPVIRRSFSDIMEPELDDGIYVVLTLDQSFWYELNEAGLQHMQSFFASAHGILWVTRGARSQNPVASMMTGLARTIRAEVPGLRLITLDLDSPKELPEDRVAEMVGQLYHFAFGQHRGKLVAEETEYYEKGGILYVARIVKSDPNKDTYIFRETGPRKPELQSFDQPDRLLKLEISQPGLLDSIRFIDDKSAQQPLAPDEVEIQVRASGMNFKDVMIGLGQIPFYHQIGLECGGIINAVGAEIQCFRPGDRVCALTKGAYGHHVRTHADLVTKIPSDTSFVDAASIPVIFCTAFHALFDIGKLQKGESILIHAAAGGVGQACIMLAQHIGADIYVTVGTPEKSKLMQDSYRLSKERIFSSRDTSFKEMLMHFTGQKGVDVVINSTAGEMLQQSFQCLAPLGRFVEIGKRDLVQNSNLEMGVFENAATFSAVDLGILSERKPGAFKQILGGVMDFLRRKVIRPVSPITVFPISEITHALRMMQGGKHMGKVVIDFPQDDKVAIMPQLSLLAVSKYAESTILVTGGTGGLGRSIVGWLASQGAKTIVAVSRSGLQQQDMARLIHEAKEIGVQIVVKSCDVADGGRVKELVADCRQSLPPIKGVIHGAMALRDVLFENMTYDEWSLNIKPRVGGAMHLYEALKDETLDFFLMLSSFTGIAGNQGQAGYTASNAFLDTFAAHLNGLNVPASVIDLGPVAGVGYVAELKEAAAAEAFKKLERISHISLTEAEVLSLVKAHITNAFDHHTDARQTITGLGIDPEKPLPQWTPDPRFSHVKARTQTQTVSSSSPGISKGNPDAKTRDAIRGAASPEEVRILIDEAFRRKLSNLLMMGAAEEEEGMIDSKKPIVAYGLDSLVAAELRNWIGAVLEDTVPLMELMNSPSINHLVDRIAEKSRLVPKMAVDTEENQV